MKKLCFILLIGLVSLPVSAKKNVIYEGFDIYNLDSDSKAKKSYFAMELGAGSELEVGFRSQMNLGKYFAWDVFHLKYAFDYDDTNVHELSFTTGVRVYTPAFINKKIKGFVSFDGGYGLSSFSYNYYGDDEREINHHFAMDLTIGLQFNDKFYVGYGFGRLTGDLSHSDHVARLGINF